MYNFVLDDEQREKFEEWNRKHKKKCKYGDSMHQGAIGGRLTFSFTPTSLGEIVNVKCACNEGIDLTSNEW